MLVLTYFFPRKADGVRPMERTGLSLETLDTWTCADVSLAVSASNSTMHNVLGPELEKFEVDGTFILSVQVCFSGLGIRDVTFHFRAPPF